MIDKTILNVIEDYREEIRILKEQVQYFSSKDMHKKEPGIRFADGTVVSKNRSTGYGEELIKIATPDGEVALLTLYDFCELIYG